MQIYKVAPDQVPRRRSLYAVGLSASGLGGVPTTQNPYPRGLPVAGQGPGGQPFKVDWSPVMNTWVAYSPFGAFPLWTDATFARIQQQIACQAPFNTMYAGYNDGTNQWADVLGYYDQNNLYGGDVCRAPFDFFNSGMLSKNGQLPLITAGPPCGTGTQTATYALDPATGFYVPVSVQGSNNCPDISMLESFGIFVGMLATLVGGAALLAPAHAGVGTGGAAEAETRAAVAPDQGGGVPQSPGFHLPPTPAGRPLVSCASPPPDIAPPR